MKKTLINKQVLVYYDLPQLFIAEDELGYLYLCLLTNDAEGDLEYVATLITDARLYAFSNGKIDLRTIFTEPELKQWFSVTYENDTYTALLLNLDALPEDKLPSEGFFINASDNIVEEIIEEVVQKENAITHLSVSDAYNNNSIDTDNLSYILLLYQTILKHCYKKTLSQHNPELKKSLLSPINYKLRLFNTSPGSFRMHFYSQADKDIFGKPYLLEGLRLFNELINDNINEDDYINILKKVKGHAINNFSKMLNYLINNDLSITHKWRVPAEDTVYYSEIHKSKAKRLIEIINKKTELVEETRLFIGYFVKVDIKHNSWRIYNFEDGTEYKGISNDISLNGITIKSVNYRVECTEIVEEYSVTENEKTSYILKNIAINP